MTALLAFGGLLVLLSFLFLYFGVRKAKESQILKSYLVVQDLNNLSANKPVVVSGNVNSESPLNSPLTPTPCVYYKLKYER